MPDIADGNAVFGGGVHILYHKNIPSLRGAPVATTLAPHASAGEQSHFLVMRLLRVEEHHPRNDGNVIMPTTSSRRLQLAWGCQTSIPLIRVRSPCGRRG